MQQKSGDRTRGFQEQSCSGHVEWCRKEMYNEDQCHSIWGLQKSIFVQQWRQMSSEEWEAKRVWDKGTDDSWGLEV